MREIKFRALREKHKELGDIFPEYREWLYSNGYFFDGTNYWFMLHGKQTCVADAKYVIIDIKTLGEYIGQIIKGEEIYERDILKRGDSCGEVYYNESLAQFVIDGHYGERQVDKAMHITPLNIKLGNVYENPELLK